MDVVEAGGGGGGGGMDLLTSLDPPLKREVSYNRCTCRRDF